MAAKDDKTPLNKIYDVRTVVAFMTPNHSWVLGTVAAYDVRTKQYACTATDPEPMTVERIPATHGSIWAPRVEYLEEDVNDLLQLTELHEASLLFCLKKRYLRDVVYTNIGPIVIALNPFNYNIPWYMDAKMPDYLSEGVEIERNLPHSWAVAHNSYWEMRENGANQSILISGESGAGKTEAAKIVINYLGNLSTVNGTPEQQAACREVNKRVNAASPILEAFGNAKTVRNDNSSRFGKFARIQFDKDGFLIGSFATKYLLEKSRIIGAAADERVYHSYYQLAAGADGTDYHIRSAKLHRMLLSGGCVAIDGVDDALEYLATKQAMADVGMLPDEQRGVWLIVAGILFFQNLEFIETEERTGKVSAVDPIHAQVLTRTCELWRIPVEDMQRELLTVTMDARGEKTVKFLSKAQALDTRDSVSKSLYDWLFEWIVGKINETTDAASRAVLWVGLLDIFGFENFKQNNYEQLCINLANETLQQHYNQHIFTEDMRECKEEGIDTTDVQFVDNKECLELLLSKTGIFTLLDDECMINGTEQNFLQKINSSFLGSKTKPSHPFYGQTTGRAMDNHFRIKHYAAEVQYCTDNILDKNRDTLKAGMKCALRMSELPLLKAIAPPASEDNAKTKLTVGGHFRAQLKELMELINGTNPHWIRCIKPHPLKQPRLFSHNEVMSQLRSAGVLDTVKVRKAGYPIRFKIDLFLTRYRILVTKDMQAAAGGSQSAICRQMFENLAITSAIGQMGKTKVFLRHDAFTRLNHAKDEATTVFSQLLQSVGRACRERAALFRQYVVRHREKIMEERRRREEALRRQREEEERKRREEAEEAARQARRAHERLVRATILVQRMVRGSLARSWFVRRHVEEMRAREERRLDDGFQRFRLTFDDLDRRVKIIEKRQLEAETSKVVATQKTHENRRRALVEAREARMRAIEEAERHREVNVQRDIKTDMEAARRQRREADRIARHEYEVRVREARAREAHRREQTEARFLQAAAELMPSTHGPYGRFAMAGGSGGGFGAGAASPLPSQNLSNASALYAGRPQPTGGGPATAVGAGRLRSPTGGRGFGGGGHADPSAQHITAAAELRYLTNRVGSPLRPNRPNPFAVNPSSLNTFGGGGGAAPQQPQSRAVAAASYPYGPQPTVLQGNARASSPLFDGAKARYGEEEAWAERRQHGLVGVGAGAGGGGGGFSAYDAQRQQLSVARQQSARNPSLAAAQRSAAQPNYSTMASASVGPAARYGGQTAASSSFVAPSSPFEARYRERVLDDAYNTAEASRLINERRAMGSGGGF